MPLEDLLELVGTLRDRIDEHGNELRQSEALTRYALIDVGRDRKVAHQDKPLNCRSLPDPVF